MIDVLVFIHRDASLARIDAVARELEQAGLRLKGKYPSVGIVAGSVEDRSLLNQFQKLKDVTAVTEK
jgi:hypothetical protein